MAVKGQGQAISCTTEPRICEGPTRKWGMILRGQEEGGEHRDETNVEDVSRDISFVNIYLDISFLFDTRGGEWKEDPRTNLSSRERGFADERGCDWRRIEYDFWSREDKWIRMDLK